MTDYVITWDAVTLDDSGEPVTVSEYRIYVDGALAGTAFSPREFVVSVAPGETKVVTITAVGPGGEGAPSVPVTIVEPSGVPNAPAGVQATAV